MDKNKDYELVQRILATIPDVRFEKVEKAKEKINDDPFYISTEELADKLISKFKERQKLKNNTN